MYDSYSNNQSPTSPTTPQKVIRFDKGYLKSLPGILKIVQLLCNLIGFICIKVSLNTWISGIFYNLLYWLAMVITGILLLMYLFHFVEKYSHWPWLKVELFYCGAVAIIYIVLSILASTIGEGGGYAVSFFGVIAIIAYAFDGYLKYKGWKEGKAAQ